MFSILKAIYHGIRWLLKQRKLMEKDANGYLSEERAKQWRLNTEKVFAALAEGRGASVLPASVNGVAKWALSKTTADDRLGEFGKVFLKSAKMHNKDESLKDKII